MDRKLVATLRKHKSDPKPFGRKAWSQVPVPWRGPSPGECDAVPGAARHLLPLIKPWIALFLGEPRLGLNL